MGERVNVKFVPWVRIIQVLVMSFAGVVDQDFMHQHAQKNCIHCPKGTYNGYYDVSECTPCPGGFFTNTTGNIECFPCPAGTYSPKGSSKCYDCPVGTHSRGALETCWFCEHNTFANT